MRRYLVVAHRTLGGPHLVEELVRRREADPFCTFHLVVPEYHPTRIGWDDHEVRQAARATLAEMLERLAEMRIGATGEIGASNPVYAVGQVIRRPGAPKYAGIILSTLPHSVSNWWVIGVPSRMSVTFPDIPLTHLVAKEALVGH